MKVLDTGIDGLKIIEPVIFSDKRGYFFEPFNFNNFKKWFHGVEFIQDNESCSTYGVLRGLHFQKPPYEQSKLVRVIEGKVLDVVVDLRKNSPTYGKHFSLIIDSKNKLQMFIPKGFAHGFIVLSKFAIFSYKVDNVYAPNFEGGLLWNDEDLNINWKISKKLILTSKKDNLFPVFKNFNSPF